MQTSLYACCQFAILCGANFVISCRFAIICGANFAILNFIICKLHYVQASLCANFIICNFIICNFIICSFVVCNFIICKLHYELLCVQTSFPVLLLNIMHVVFTYICRLIWVYEQYKMDSNFQSQMKNILEKLGLGSLTKRFLNQTVTPDIVYAWNAQNMAL